MRYDEKQKLVHTLWCVPDGADIEKDTLRESKRGVLASESDAIERCTLAQLAEAIRASPLPPKTRRELFLEMERETQRKEMVHMECLRYFVRRKGGALKYPRGTQTAIDCFIRWVADQ